MTPEQRAASLSTTADNVVDLAMLMAEMTGRERYKAEAGGLGFAYDFREKTVGIIVDWQGKRALQVIAHLGGTGARVVQPFDDGSGWGAEVKRTLADLLAVQAAQAAEAIGKPN